MLADSAARIDAARLLAGTERLAASLPGPVVSDGLRRAALCRLQLDELRDAVVALGDQAPAEWHRRIRAAGAQLEAATAAPPPAAAAAAPSAAPTPAPAPAPAPRRRPADAAAAQQHGKKLVDQLMGELGGMASQLKQSSLSLHDSLKQSNNTVDGLGEAAEANAAKVAAEAERVAKTSRKRMKATCASMGAIGAILATFVLTYLFAIKLFPKRAVFEARRVEGGGGEL